MGMVDGLLHALNQEGGVLAGTRKASSLPSLPSVFVAATLACSDTCGRRHSLTWVLYPVLMDDNSGVVVVVVVIMCGLLLRLTPLFAISLLCSLLCPASSHNPDPARLRPAAFVPMHRQARLAGGTNPAAASCE